MIGIGLASLATWLSATLPAESATHVDIWPPIGIFVVVVVVGVYVMVAAESKSLWLPDRKKFEAGAEQRFQESLFDFTAEPKALVAQIVQSLDALTDVISRLAPPDQVDG